MKRTFLVSLMVLIFFTGLVFLHAKAGGSSNEPQRRKLIEQVNAAESIQINIDNSQGSPFIIQGASVKEVSGEDFSLLTGEPAKHFQQSTFPEVILWNSSQKTITSFAVAIQSAVDKPNSWHGVLKSNLSIPSNTSYIVKPKEWLKAEKVLVEKDGEFVSRLQQPLLDSVKAWLPGAAADLKVTVGMVEFEDGTKWIVPSTSK